MHTRLADTPRLRVLCIALAVAALAGACTSDPSPAVTGDASGTIGTSRVPMTSRTAHSSPGSSSSSSRSAGVVDRARSVFDAMSEAQRVGQLIMVDCPSSGVAEATVTAIRDYDVGSVILDGNSSLGVTRTRQITLQLQQITPRAPRLFIATDQEGGLVQRLRGPGFSSIPSALAQGTSSPAALRADSTRWGLQLRSAGISVDLAPVLDTVPAGGAGNPPIGDLDREYGRTPNAVALHGVAAAQGLAAAGVAATAKHFPGLGRVTGNTDTSGGITDSETVRHDASLAPFASAVTSHVPFVMVSTAIYSRIDAGVPATFSKTIIAGMLRGDLGFRGIVITDDIGAAAQLRSYPPGQRAVSFIAAGGTIALTVDPAVVAAMTSALLSRARHDAAFRRQVDAAALLVLRTKAAYGLL